MRSFFVYLKESLRTDSVARPFLALSPLSIVKVDVSEISNRLPDYPTLKNNSHEA